MTNTAHAHTFVHKPVVRTDRPGWVPAEVGDDWDPDPHAYQSEEELMRASITHNIYLYTTALALMPHIEQLGLLLCIDAFMLYRDAHNVRQRIAPDITIVPADQHTQHQGNQETYDLDICPPPVCIIEVITPTSNEKDLDIQRPLFQSLGISEYLVLAFIEKTGQAGRSQMQLSLWRLVEGHYMQVWEDEEGFLPMQSINIRIRADGRNLVMLNMTTGEKLLTAVEQKKAQEQARN